MTRGLNSLRLHRKLRLNPAMAAGICDRLWCMDDIAALMDAAAIAPGKRGSHKKSAQKTTNQHIDAQRITKPIQLLAAWLIGLVIVDGSFLGAAINIGPGWERTFLVCASIANVPGFLFALFLLQTKFRPELQEDTYYYDYISQKTNATIELSNVDFLERRLADLTLRFEAQDIIAVSSEPDRQVVPLDWITWKVALNINLPFQKDLIKDLAGVRINVANYFGEDVSEPLKEYVVSISSDMDADHTLAILKVVVKHPFDKFNF